MSFARSLECGFESVGDASGVALTGPFGPMMPVYGGSDPAGAGGMFEVNVHRAQVFIPVIVASVGTIFAVAVQPLRDVWVLTKKRTVTNQLVIHGTPVIRFNSPLPIETSLLL